MKKGQDFDTLRINMDKMPKPKNKEGLSGERCNNCGGYGYTVGMNGAHIYCKDCGRTGVKMPTMMDLVKRITALEEDLKKLRTAIIHSPIGIELRGDKK